MAKIKSKYTLKLLGPRLNMGCYEILSEIERRNAMPNNDPWEHRSVKMRCETCMWYVAKKRTGAGAADEAVPIRLGRCRKRAPFMNGYPAVFPADWCGDHKLDENKI